MANILLVDPSDVAKKAMQGIVARGSHRFVAVDSPKEAWDFVQQNVAVDMVFVELKLGPESGLALIERWSADPFLQLLPVVVYASQGDRDTVRRATALKVQNFLVKPYQDEHVLEEINKAILNPWRARHFEEEKSFCAMMGYTPAGLRTQLEQLKMSLTASVAPLIEHARIENLAGALGQLTELNDAAEAAGAWGVVEYISRLKGKAEMGTWHSFVELTGVTFAERLITQHLNPGEVPEGFITEEERNREKEAETRALWFNAPGENRCPVVGWHQLSAEIDALNGCPVIDSVAAAFQMGATGHPSSLGPLMDIAEKDPGLCAQLLVAANQLRGTDDLDPEPIDNPSNCVSLLGDLRLAAMAKGLITAPQRLMNVPPCTWMSFWTFQMGVARMARYTCNYLEFQSLESRAYAAGLMHDLGKIILLYLHPIGFQAVVEYSRTKSLPLTEAEQKFFGATSREVAERFAVGHGLLPAYAHVMRWVEEPAEAPDDPLLVAIVSLARDICRLNRFGWTGDLPGASAPHIAETAGWAVLKQRVFPSFNLEKFVAEANTQCRELNRELHGQFSATRS